MKPSISSTFVEPGINAPLEIKKIMAKYLLDVYRAYFEF